MDENEIIVVHVVLGIWIYIIIPRFDHSVK